MVSGALPTLAIESYLSNHKQYVSVLGKNSDLEDVIYNGVPQRSCLGPNLYK